MRALTGTWVIDEVGLSAQNGYRISEVYEVYAYKLTRYDPETRDGGPFTGYIDTFLKLKAKTSGYPTWTRSTADEERHIESFRNSEGNG